MSHLVSFFMLLSLMLVMVNTKPQLWDPRVRPPTKTKRDLSSAEFAAANAAGAAGATRGAGGAGGAGGADGADGAGGADGADGAGALSDPHGSGGAEKTCQGSNIIG